MRLTFLRTMRLGSVFLRASCYAAILIACAGSWNQRVLWGQTLTGSQTPSTLELSGRVVDARNRQPIAPGAGAYEWARGA